MEFPDAFDEPTFLRGFLDSERVRDVLYAVPKETMCNLGRFVYADPVTGNTRPFMHPSTWKVETFESALRAVESAPEGAQVSARVELETPVPIGPYEFDIVRVGCKGWTVPTHFDCCHNFVLCVSGTRTFECSPPSPTFPKKHVKRYVLEPGDLLCVPAGWWHQVRGSSDAYSALTNARTSHRFPELERSYDRYWPGRALEQENGFDRVRSDRTGYDLAVECGTHRYEDLLAYESNEDVASDRWGTFAMHVALVLSTVWILFAFVVR